MNYPRHDIAFFVLKVPLSRNQPTTNEAKKSSHRCWTSAYGTDYSPWSWFEVVEETPCSVTGEYFTSEVFEMCRDINDDFIANILLSVSIKAFWNQSVLVEVVTIGVGDGGGGGAEGHVPSPQTKMIGKNFVRNYNVNSGIFQANIIKNSGILIIFRPNIT